MQRDNKGRFVKKAQGGTQLWADGYEFTWGNNKYRVKAGANQAFAPVKANYKSIEDWLGTDGLDYVESINSPKQKTRSAGMNFTTGRRSKNSNAGGGFNSINKDKLAGFLELARVGIGSAVNNKIAERALEVEKPFLQDVSESHRSVYGDYRSQVQGEKTAAQLRNLASKPITSDGALQQQMMMEAQLKGNDYIEQGNAKDDAVRRQTQEVAWQQEKENQQQRQAVAMQNKQAMLMSDKNKEQIINMRDSANYSQVVGPYLEGMEERLRQKAAEQDYYQNYYNEALVNSDVWNNYSEGLTPKQLELRNLKNSGGSAAVETYLAEHPEYTTDWNQLNAIMRQQAIINTAALRGVTIDPKIFGNTTTNSTDLFNSGTNYFPISNKNGGTIYKAKLTKRTKDNDRTSRSIESSKKIAARFLEKAMDSLYTYDQVELIAKPKKKRKYQAGGGLPFVGFTPVFATSETGAPKVADTKKSKEADLTTKDILELLKDMDGLPVDESLIVSALQNFHMSKQDDPLGIMSSSDLASQYLSIIHKIKTAKFNKEEYNNAFNQLKGNGGLSELAVTSEGMLIGSNDNGEFKYFTPEEAAKGSPMEKGYQLLTNSNLLYLRANSVDAAFNHKLITVAQNGVGMETINKLIFDSIANLGTSGYSEEGYTKTKQGELLEGLEDFYKAVQASDGNFDGTINDLYKYKLLTKTQAEQAKKAMQYVYNTLPSNVKALLKVKSDGSDMGALKLIETIISSKETSLKQIELDLVGGKTHKSTSESAKDISDLETSLPLNILKNVGGVDSYLDIDRGDGIHLKVKGTQFNQIKAPNGEPIYDTSMATMLQKSGLQSIVKDMRNIQFGDQRISPEILASITYNNTGITRANLPIKPDGSVNLDLLEKYEQAEQEIDALSDRSLENIKQIYEKYGLTSLLNADGSYNLSKFGAFMVTEGYTTDALSGLKESEFVKEFQGDPDSTAALIQRCLQIGTGKNAQTPDIDTLSWYNPGDWFGWTDVIYKGVVYIPITNNVNTAVFGANQSLDYDEALLQEEKYQNFEKMSRQKSTDSELLNI